MAFPPSEEGFDGSAQFVDQRDLFGRQIKTVGGNPVGFVVSFVTNHTDFPFGLVRSLVLPNLTLYC